MFVPETLYIVIWMADMKYIRDDVLSAGTQHPELRADLVECFVRGQMTFGEDQMVFWKGPNCPKKLTLSMQRHRHHGDVKTLHLLEGAKSWFQSPHWEGRHDPVGPPYIRTCSEHLHDIFKMNASNVKRKENIFSRLGPSKMNN